MSHDNDVAVLGVGMHPWGKWGRNFVSYGVHAALAADPTEDAPWISDCAGVASNARITGATMIAPGAEVGAGAALHDCIVWQSATVEAGAHLTRCIVADGATALGEHADVDFVAG